MNKLRFWNLIETSAKEADGDPAEQAKILTERLGKLSPEEIAQFQRFLDEQMALTYRWDLRGAAHVIHGGISDKKFESFRGWLIAQGKAVCEGAMDDPDSLAEIVEEETDGRPLLLAASQAHKSKTGKGLAPVNLADGELSGEEWAVEDLPELFPALWGHFGEEEETE